MRSSAANNVPTVDTPQHLLGPSFGVLMHVRALLTVAALFALPGSDTGIAVFIVVALAFLYWLAGRYWERIVPRLVAHPLLTGIDLLISLVVLSAEGPSGPFFQSTVAASAVAGLLFRWRGMLLVAVTQIACYFAAYGYYDSLMHDGVSTLTGFQQLFGQPAYYPIIGLVGVMLRRLFDAQAAADAARQLAESRQAAADERARLAREMHDSLAKTLRGIAMSAQALPIWVRKSPDRAADEARRLASAAEIASREARELITDLRDDQVQERLVTTVREVSERWAAGSGVSVYLDLDERAELPLVARYELVAILKEALVNIGRHADAHTVSVRLRGDDAVMLTVEDDGAGFDAPTKGPDWLDELARAGHYGVVGMHERAKRAGAELTMRSSSGRGTTMTVAFGAHTQAEPVDDDSQRQQPAEAG